MFGENNLQKILGRVLKLLELAAWRGQGLGLLPEGGVGNGVIKSHSSLQANILILVRPSSIFTLALLPEISFFKTSNI